MIILTAYLCGVFFTLGTTLRDAVPWSVRSATVLVVGSLCWPLVLIWMLATARFRVVRGLPLNTVRGRDRIRLTGFVGEDRALVWMRRR